MSSSEIKFSSRCAFSYNWNKCIENEDSCFIRTVKSVVGFFKGFFGRYAVSKADIDSFLANDKNKGCIFYKECSKKNLLKRSVRQANYDMPSGEKQEKKINKNKKESSEEGLEKVSMIELEDLIKKEDFNILESTHFSKKNMKLLEEKDCCNLLKIACEQKKVNLATLLLGTGKCTNLTSLSENEKGSILSLFASENRIADLRYLLAKCNIPVDSVNDRGDTSLIVAAKSGKEESLDFLLKHGAGINKKDENGWSALHWASQMSHTKCINVLLESDDIEINARDDNGCTALHIAVKVIASFDVLVKVSDVNAKNKDGDGPLHLASNPGIIKELLKKGASITMQNNLGNTPLHVFAINGINAVSLKVMLKAVNIQNNDGDTVLHKLVTNHESEEDKCRITMLGQLLKSSDVNKLIKNNENRTPLEYARYHKCGVSIELLNRKS